MRKSKLLVWGGFAASALTVAPLVVAASCSSDNSSPAVDNSVKTINASNVNLGAITLNGSVQNLALTIPPATIMVNDKNELSETGTKAALEVWIRTSDQVGSSQETTNHSYMPLVVMQAYLSNRIKYEEGFVKIKIGATWLGLNATYRSDFGFNNTNTSVSDAPTRVISKSSFSVKLNPLTGYALSAADAAREAAPAVSATFKELAIISLPSQDTVIATFLRKIGWKAGSTAAALTYDPINISEMPADWIPYVSAVEFSKAATVDSTTVWSATPPTTLPTTVSERHFWVRLVAKAGYELSFQPIDLYQLIAPIVPLA